MISLDYKENPARKRGGGRSQPTPFEQGSSVFYHNAGAL